MSLTRSFKQVLSSGIDSYNAPKDTEICEVDVVMMGSLNNPILTWSEWKEELRPLLQSYDSVGWLDDFNKIIIGDMSNVTAVGEYTSRNRTIQLDHKLDTSWYGDKVLDTTLEHVVTHEMIHHAHITRNGFDKPNAYFNESLIKDEVSYYGEKNVYEAVAEIGSGIVHGHEFCEKVHEFYDMWDGPQEVYDL